MNKILLLVFIMGTLYSQCQSIDGFRGWKWGTPYSEVETELIKSRNKIPGFKAYDKIGDKLEYEGMQVRLITYGFKKNVFKAINIGMYSKDIDAIIEVFTKKYGKPKQTEMEFLKNWEWHLENADISVAFIPTKKENGISVGIKGK